MKSQIRLSEQLKQGGLFYWFQFLFISLYFGVKCHVIDFRSICCSQRRFFFIPNWNTNAKKCIMQQSAMFLFSSRDFLLMYLESNARERASCKKRVHKQKQCIENGSLWRAFNELRFHCVHIHRFQQFRYTVWCKALQRVLVSTHFFLSLLFIHIASSNMIPKTSVSP